MARANSSPFYPPRARWYSPTLSAFDGVRRTIALDRLNPRLTSDIDLLGLVGCFIIPALGFYLRLPALIGRALVAWALLLTLAFFAFLGRWEDNLIFSMLLSLHVSGFVFYCTPLLGPSVWRRLGFTLAMTLAIYLLVYLPAQSFLQAYVVTPLEVHDRSVIVGHVSSTSTIRAGDWLAYTIPDSGYYGGVDVERGSDIAQVLAVPGDRVTFDALSYSVNGVAHPRLPLMPSSGKFIVPEKEWFIWPHLAIAPGRRIVDEEAVAAAILRRALVTEDQLLGRPFQQWFWWNQKQA